jgi:hypothetical protein
MVQYYATSREHTSELNPCFVQRQKFKRIGKNLRILGLVAEKSPNVGKEYFPSQASFAVQCGIVYE